MSVSDREEGHTGSSTEGAPLSPRAKDLGRMPGYSVATNFSVIHEDDMKEVELAVETRILSINDDDSTFRVALLIHALYKDEDMPETTTEDKFVRVESSDYMNTLKFVVLRSIDNQVSEQFHKVVRVNQHFKAKLVWTTFYATTTISDTMQLKKFPFDRHVFSVVLQAPDVKLTSWQHKKELAEFRKINGLLEGVESQGHSAFVVSGMLKRFVLKGLSVFFTPVVSQTKTVNDAEFVINIHVERDTRYYFLNFVFIVYLIGSANSALVAVLPDVIAARNGVTVTLLLTLISFKFTIMSNSPKVGYTTYMDQYVRVAFLYLIMSVVINITISTRFQCIVRGYTSDCDVDTLREDEGLNTNIIDFPVQIVLWLCWSTFNLIVYYFFKHPDLVRYKWEQVIANKESGPENAVFSTNQAVSTLKLDEIAALHKKKNKPKKDKHKDHKDGEKDHNHTPNHSTSNPMAKN